MGFYGNITNTSKTQFNFDRIYPNRKAMDDACKADGVAIGRFVLVEYGETDFDTNYNKDKKVYGIARGYDSTVWQKIYVDQFEKYVMIAELNSVVPTFSLGIDAPTMTPLVPHFDKRDTNVSYRLHIQPQWGMRIKEAPDSNIEDIEGNKIKLSDENVEWIKSFYDETTNTTVEEKETKQGNIYYNKAGFNKEKRTYYEGAKDSVSITPTGFSGNLYQDHEGNTKEAADIQEISILLPSLGNTISDIWDIIYSKDRNLDIDWNSIKGIRMVEETSDGYNYNTKNVETLAGCINSVHDLMGMIISEKDNNLNVKDADENSIYYNKDNKTFERKVVNYEYNQVEEIADENTYKSVGTNLLKYEKDTYFYKDSLDNYYKENADNPKKSKNYYRVMPVETSLVEKYIPNKWYYLENNNYIKAVSNEDLGKKYLEIIATKNTYTWFRPLAYFRTNKNITSNEDVTQFTLVQENESFNKDYNYWYVPGQDIATWEKTTKEIIQEDGSIKKMTFIEWPNNISSENLQRIVLTPFENNKYFKLNNNDYIALMEHPLKNGKLEVSNEYYTITVDKEVALFYESDKYYLQTTEGNYLKDYSGKFNSETKYYTLNVEKIEQEFYVLGEYYEYNNGTYILSSDSNPIAEKEYFKKLIYCVISDNNNLLLPGTEWNMNVVNIPEGITLGTREEKYEMEELKGFARSFNTIQGLILEIKKLLNTEFIYTRDINTVQGAINKLNDIIVKFENLEPGTMIIVDDYGRISPAELTSDNWLEWSLDTSVIAPKFNIEHKEAQDSIITIEPNNTTTNFGNNIKIDRIAIDTKGHVKELITEEITLPKLNLETNESSGVITEISIDEDTNALVTNYTPLSNVMLEGYEKDNSIIGAIEATDTLKNGLSKIENNIQNIITDIDDRFNNWQKDLINLFVPIGFEIITADSNFDPAQHYPGTTWKRIMGKFIVGVDDSDSDFNEVDKTGGEKTVTLTVAQMPKHRHSIAITSMQLAAGDQYSRLGGQEYDNVQDEIIKNAGGNEPHNNLPPYITKYIWERIS